MPPLASAVTAGTSAGSGDDVGDDSGAGWVAVAVGSGRVAVVAALVGAGVVVGGVDWSAACSAVGVAVIVAVGWAGVGVG